jgi:hypothetical protein
MSSSKNKNIWMQEIKNLKSDLTSAAFHKWGYPKKNPFRMENPSLNG